ncbi:Fic family protein [Sphingobium cupriresistens]|uniref:Fic family protein n=1 Tax=Sphingobium cupriresistens TaxID=1132417 RepID=UPI00191C0C04|nr:Fic/DOC family N-terminal domain-containing protein [Sphingobium cupriresistens]
MPAYSLNLLLTRHNQKSLSILRIVEVSHNLSCLSFNKRYTLCVSQQQQFEMQMAGPLSDYDFSDAIAYHTDQFPPASLRYEQIINPLSKAAGALARYDTRLEGLHNKELLLAPLRNTEAVVSSRIEGTVATLDEVLKIQADADEEGNDGAERGSRYREEAIEVYSYTRAMKHAQSLITNGLPICSRVIKEAHSRLLFFGRGADKTPGVYKNDQNYVVDKRRKKVLFVPISADKLEDGISNLERYINDEKLDPLIQTAFAHVEFEALHPFKDGNGRLGRMLIPLNLWQKGKIHAPHFYVSGAIEERRDEYIDRLRATSHNGEWTEWAIFFLEIIAQQADTNIAITDKIINLYDNMKETFREKLQSQWSPVVLDYIFARPVFWNSSFTASSGIPSQTAHRLSRVLIDSDLLTVVEPAAGRRAALLAFNPLLELVRA